MRATMATALLLSTLAGPTTVMASPFGAAATAQKPAKPPATHAVRGIVKSVGATSLVIARSPKKPSDMVFVLNEATSRAGTIAVGSTVSVRYRTDGKTLVATAVTVTK